MGSNVKCLSTNMNGLKSSVNQLGSSLFDKSANPADDDVWEFKDAVSGTQSVNGNSKVTLEFFNLIWFFKHVNCDSYYISFGL